MPLFSTIANINGINQKKPGDDETARNYWKTLGVFTASLPSSNHVLIRLAKTLQCHLGIQEVWQILCDPEMTTGTLIPSLSSCPLLFLAENHAFTALAYRHIVARFPQQKLFLLILDTHLDVFSHQGDLETIHRGNFLHHLLKNGIVEEDRLFVPSLHNPIASLRESLSQFGEGLYYLSWDLDFGLPQYACFPSPLHLTFPDLREIFRLLGGHFRKQKRYLVGMDIVEMNLGSSFPLSKLSFQIVTLLQCLTLQKLPRFEPAHLDRFNH
ncbi:MAG: arginase family protein [Atribacterota bacterium]|nr:arginase family protein [Atribacterota bacterium]